MTAKYEAFFDKINKFIETYINNTKNRTGNSKNNVKRKKTQKKNADRSLRIFEVYEVYMEKKYMHQGLFRRPANLDLIITVVCDSFMTEC